MPVDDMEHVKMCREYTTPLSTEVGFKLDVFASKDLCVPDISTWKKSPKSKNAKVRVNTEESAVKPEPELKNTIECNLNPSDGPGKPNSINYEDCEDQMGPQSITTAHLCAIDKDCEDFEGPILALEQPISAIVHTKPTS
ncbi:hypothetical protein Tco_1124455 [Tanacetum coccineum]|uniref:Uncharacterized protein n=1 Tax=Tanacetum coccineum TaxID=301880 RepID=A0ABQ5J6A7_9ASTR